VTTAGSSLLSCGLIKPDRYRRHRTFQGYFINGRVRMRGAPMLARGTKAAG
jgi:hypothetical protein